MPPLNPPYYKVAIILYNGVDILDFTGPIEVLSDVKHTPNPTTQAQDRAFTITTIATTPTITTAGTSLTIKPDLLIAEAEQQLSDFDILLVPGAGGSVIDTLIASPNPLEIDLIRRFVSLAPESGRWLFSVCTGAMLLGKAGVLGGVTVATHHRFLDRLRGVCAEVSGGEVRTEIVNRRFVDSGVIGDGGVRLLSAGGVTSGIDAALYLVRGIFGDEVAGAVARDMEYEPRGL
ncbi:class I glutamine amidotransferase-like protein [Aspergillus leporis]|jgi:transcriptional regulator GlxA family with amidase domain|uniref:Class I glutamine amidotransferase-like protein n=1 Tax=Aspergillus leporis TaxID=41062 RepID=A0A5N5X004_9EURO|nr:class I glutamine amidotransferase-like protein [Aspergillus leporis]